MVELIIAAVKAALKEEFGDSYAIHTEEELQEAGFFITCPSLAETLFVGKRYFRQNGLCIRYVPKTEEKQKECMDTAERLLQCLEYITVSGEGKPMRGTKMKCEINSGVLKFLVNYDCFVCRTQQQDPMESLKTGINVKEGDSYGNSQKE